VTAGSGGQQIVLEERVCGVGSEDVLLRLQYWSRSVGKTQLDEVL
jgi:hypothetical protein